MTSFFVLGKLVLILARFSFFICRGSSSATGAVVRDDVIHKIIEIRRSLHSTPELGFELPNTSKIIEDVLRSYGFDFTSGWCIDKRLKKMDDGVRCEGDICSAGTPEGHGIVVRLGHDARKPTVLLRADMDALPIAEISPCLDIGDPICLSPSDNIGVMHACGHDLHTSILIGTLIHLQSIIDDLNINIVAIFQPAEELGIGMESCIEDGLLSPDINWRAALAIHVAPWLDVGSLVSREGSIMAASANILVTVNANGGHAAMPHLTPDPVFAGSQFVVSAQQIVSRNLVSSGAQPGIVSITNFLSGSGVHNIIPTQANLIGSIRAVTNDDLKFLKTRLIEIGEGVSKATGAEIDVDFEESCCRTEAVVNDHSLFNLFYNSNFQYGSISRMEFPWMASEDFGRLSSEVPTLFTFVGTKVGEGFKNRIGLNGNLHDPNFFIDDEFSVLRNGVDYFQEMVLRLSSTESVGK